MALKWGREEMDRVCGVVGWDEGVWMEASGWIKWKREFWFIQHDSPRNIEILCFGFEPIVPYEMPIND